MEISTMRHGGMGGEVVGPRGGVKRVRNPAIGAWVKGEVGANGACHLHVLLWGLSWLENREGVQGWSLREAWRRISGSHIVNVQVVTGRRRGKRWKYHPEALQHAGGIVEFAKYVAKPAGSGRYAVETAVAIDRFRIWRRYGSARNPCEPEEFDHHFCPLCKRGHPAPVIYGEWGTSIEQAAELILAFPVPRGPPDPVRIVRSCEDRQLDLLT